MSNGVNVVLRKYNNENNIQVRHIKDNPSLDNYKNEVRNVNVITTILIKNDKCNNKIIIILNIHGNWCSFLERIRN